MTHANKTTHISAPLLSPVLDSILAKCQISRDYLVSVAEQAGLNLTWLQTPKDRSANDVAHLLKEVL